MKKNGFTLIELLISIGLAALFLPAIIFVLSFSLGAASQGENYTRAYAIAQENMEAIYFLKENSSGNWQWTNISPQNTSIDNEYYQPENNAGEWILGNITSNPQEIDGYTTTVKILPVERHETTGNITENPGDPKIIDLSTRKIIVKVSWEEKGVPTDIELVSYVTKH